jgi:hypothetical protein
MEEVDAEISEMKLFLNGRARFVAEGYLAQVFPFPRPQTDVLVHIVASMSKLVAASARPSWRMRNALLITRSHWTKIVCVTNFEGHLETD